MTAAPPRLPSIQQRLSRVLVVASLLWGVAVSAVVWLAVRHEVDELMDQTLEESGEILFGLLSLSLPAGSYSEQLPRTPRAETLVWQVLGADGQVLLRSHDAPQQALAPGHDQGFATVGERWRVHALRFADGRHLLQVAQPLHERREARREAAALTAGAALLVGLLCAVALRLRVRRELAPIVTLSQAVAHFEPAAGGAPLAAATRAELLPMQDAINALAQRLAKRLASERAFSAHAAHALRTPLAGLVAQLAVAQRLSPPEAQPQLQRARSAADRLRRVVSALLALFRSGTDLQRQTVDLVELVGHLPFDGMQIVARPPCRVAADADLLLAALLNLFDNAHRHGASRVTLHVDDAGQLHVADDGSGIPPDRRRALQAALDMQDGESHVGLGLWLADLVARAHGGRLQLLDVDQGCEVLLALGETLVNIPEDKLQPLLGSHS